MIPNPGPVRSWYRRHHPISTLCADYDNFIFHSIQYWSFTNTTTHIKTFDVSSIASFVDSFDVLKHYTSLQNLHIATIPPHYKSQLTTSPLYQQILLEARELQQSLDQYNNKESLPPTIFTSCHHNELSIVIDTSASMSITSKLSDFAITPVPSTTKSLGSLTTAKTTVSGEGKAT